MKSRQDRGRVSHLKGQAAEECVARAYEARGVKVLSRRWRGSCGEVDLVLQEPNGDLVFTEVKTSKTMARALQALRPRQIERLVGSAAEYLGMCAAGQRTAMRFDLAAVDGFGRVEVIENAITA